MPFGQGWLNAWVKVNSKHVVFPPVPNDKEDGKHHRQGDRKHSLKGADASVKTAPTVGSEYAETQAIRRFNNRKHRRRGLHRTISATDLIREQGKQKGEKKGDNSDFLDRSSSTHATSNRFPMHVAGNSDFRPTVAHVAQHEEPSVISNDETEGSLRFVAGFFGTEIAEAEAAKALDDQSRSLHSRNDVDSVHHPASVHQIGSYTHLDSATVGSRGGHSLPAGHPSALPRSDSQDSRDKGVIGIRFPPNLFSGDNNSKTSCRQCTKLEGELTSSREDLEYLRGIALRSEYICATCQCEPQRRAEDSLKSQITGHERPELLDEVTSRHKSQIEKLAEDRASWQNDAHVKLQQFGGLCRDLNEEAAIRNEEAIELHKELDSVRQDRDRISAELEQAKAKIAQHEKNESERPRIESMMMRLEANGLDGVERAIKTRDKIIVDLSTRLERALDCLEFEREQQRQRRQIIFPAQRGPSASEGRSGEDLEAEMKTTKDSLRESQGALESLQHGMEKKEREWAMKLESLERQLEAARADSKL
mmetsp:Transcript_9064/g.14554  ORF Transcript_9064/g.14554 Transcript_9064/m.14554 type:complete len:535 (+) Transcript_9064:232-1836(+)|eukprot:CAMPEP_0117020574 /NCGR_PEP_ID=MMETSP0472-20121206/15625_1 /TAXON_ID=693140 ORGANISM="Tiarina fusus, Strain LIS" /NCGR_SAMPLE_ID=MMETSP0472 /ASSEMBLY_ACC=CAM_ASM_000603 /LENGTH=534 /DNA_ID=CAMNT_0004725821 /DNA_START=216 /DNA_END=1820 /DNA_ORIENTATION=+